MTPMLNLFTTLALALVPPPSRQEPTPKPPPPRPNIVLIFLDDSGYGDYSHNGNPTISTPNISRLAHQGLSFTQFYVATAACSASRYSLLTGRYPARSGLGSWVIGPKSPRYLHPKEFTLAEGLKSAGYATALFGKWHLGTPNKKNGDTKDAFPLAHGFDQWVGTNVSHDYDQAQLLRSDPKGNTPIPGYRLLADRLPSNPKASKSLTSLYTREAIRFIKANRHKPFFAYIAYNQPHLGLYVSDAYRGRSRRGLLGDVMAEIDDSVGQILQTLRDSRRDRNTLVIFSSDNGPWVRFRNTKHHPKYGEARLHVGYAYPFRDGKGSTWEGGHRVPGIFYWPGTISPRRELRPASTLDILPTLFRLCGVPLPKDLHLDGRDIRPLLSPKLAPGTRVPPFHFLYSYSDNRPSALRMGPWKLHIRLGSQLRTNYGFKASRSHPLLFQLEEDPGERIDRAAEQPALVQRMLKALEEDERMLRAEGSFWDPKK
ncbi:MAG TPA: arylsulfatase [Planctomycetes bacterium]|nr:arylsulfatase [Planctomycetota bacterium]